MATDKGKWIDAIAKMIKLTQEGKMIWNATPPSSDIPTETELVYSTRYKNHTLRLYDTADQISRVFNDHSAVLEFIDENGRTLWTYPKMEALNHLLLSVEYQTAGVKDFLKDILSEA